MIAPEKLLNKKQESAAIRRVMTLLAIPGKSGEELPVARHIEAELKQAGAAEHHISYDTAHHRTPKRGQVGNLILKLPGTFKAPRRLLVSHMDTVPICVGCKPKRDGMLVTSSAPGTGLGADDRAGVGTILTAATEILSREIPHPPLTFLWTIQEEVGLQGARALQHAKLGRPKLAFNWDGGSPCKLTLGATGGYRMDITVEGLAAHAGNAPDEGISAIAIAGVAIARLHQNGWHGLVTKGDKCGTCNIGMIQGGEATNVVTDRVALRAEARSHDAEFRQQIVAQIREAFEFAVDQVRCAATNQQGSVSFDGDLDYEAFSIPADSEAVTEAREVIEQLGEQSQLAVTNGGLDANWLFAHGIPTVSLGCGQRNQHMVTEQLDLDEYLLACRIALALATVSPEQR